MPQQYKIDKVAEIESRIAENAGLFVVNYNGLTVKQAQELRHQLRECGAEMKVYKNNLVKIALKNRGAARDRRDTRRPRRLCVLRDRAGRGR